jgi:putative FmdB family regulatory protein
MAIYEYVCRKCGHKFEKRVGFFQVEKAAACPKCQSAETERVFSPFSSSSGSCSTFSRRR